MPTTGPTDAFVNVGPAARNAGQEYTNGVTYNVMPDLEGKDLAEQLEVIANRLEVETRIRDGAERILQVLTSEGVDGKEHLRKEVEAQLSNAKEKIAAMSALMEQIRGSPHSARARKKLPALTNNKRNVSTNQTQPNGKQKEDTTDRDDFRTALNQARSMVQVLVSYRARFQGHLQPSPLTSTISPYSPPDVSPLGTSPLSATPMNERDMDRSRTGIMSALVTVLQRNVRLMYELDAIEVVRSIVPALADYASKESRAAAYRLIRHVIVDAQSLERLRPFGLDWYMVRSLARDNKHSVEKEQVLKLIRTYVDVGTSRKSPSIPAGSNRIPLSDAVMRAVIAVAEHPEDQFRHLALETLTEIALTDVALLSRTDGMRVILQALSDGPHEISPIIASALLYLVDAPRTRVYLRPGVDLEIALTGFTDAYGKGTAHTERMRASAKVIATMLRSWSGLMYLCMSNMRAIASIINTLSIPSLETREVVLDLFFDVLKIDTPDWYKAYIDGRRLTVIAPRATAETIVMADPEASYSNPSSKLTFMHQYLSLLLLVFLKAGLLEALIGVLEETDIPANLSRKATLLLGEILQIAGRVLPSSMAADIQSLPRLFELAADTQKLDDARKVATCTLASLDSFNRNRARLQKPEAQPSRRRANSIEDTVRSHQRQVEQSKIKLSMQIDDKTFQDIILKTQVMVAKEHTKWNLDALMELIEGPLMNPKRLEEAFRVLRFGKKLISFFHPFANRFSSLRNIPSNQRYVQLGCALLTTLVSCAEGVKFLASEDPLLKQIVDCFNQLDPFNSVQTPDPVFSKERMTTTLSYGYFDMLGTLSKQAEGIELMERFKLFTSFYHISELRSREDLIKGIIENVDYSAGGHSRIILSKALTSSYMHVRLFATTHLGHLIRTSSKASDWMLRLLLTQLYDPALEVRELAVAYLEVACESMDVLELVVQMRPNLDHLGDVGHPLLLKFMSTTVGFRYLYKSGYIDKEMDAWFHDRNSQYVIQVEVCLSRAFSSDGKDEDENLMFDGTVPPHFYGEMAKTELGCQVLSDKAHFPEFAHFIRQHGLEEEDFEIIHRLKSNLWAVGNIGSTTGGLPFLEEEGVIPHILDIAETSQVLSVRGTAFFVLGLISSTTQGAEILDEFEWEATMTPLGDPTGLCIPLDITTFVQIPPWEPADDLWEPPWIQPVESSMEAQILTAISNLQNTVIANEAARSLTRWKSTHRAIFSSVPLFYRVLHLLSTQRYRLPVRRYILDLFDIDLDPDVMASLYSLSATLHSRPPSPVLKRTPPSAEGGVGLGLNVITSPQPPRKPEVNGRQVNGTKEANVKPNNTSAAAKNGGAVVMTPVRKEEGFGGKDIDVD